MNDDNYSVHIVDCFTHLGGYAYNLLAAILSNLLLVSFVILCNLPGILNLTQGSWHQV